jgi:hypothetical protein
VYCRITFRVVANVVVDKLNCTRAITPPAVSLQVDTVAIRGITIVMNVVALKAHLHSQLREGVMRKPHD